MTHRVRGESEHMARSLATEASIVQNKSEEGTKLAKVGITTDEARRVRMG
jgi:hypothetical protein